MNSRTKAPKGMRWTRRPGTGSAAASFAAVEKNWTKAGVMRGGWILVTVWKTAVHSGGRPYTRARLPDWVRGCAWMSPGDTITTWRGSDFAAARSGKKIIGSRGRAKMRSKCMTIPTKVPRARQTLNVRLDSDGDRVEMDSSRLDESSAQTCFGGSRLSLFGCAKLFTRRCV